MSKKAGRIESNSKEGRRAKNEGPDASRIQRVTKTAKVVGDHSITDSCAVGWGGATRTDLIAGRKQLAQVWASKISSALDGQTEVGKSRSRGAIVGGPGLLAG